ncbi:CU044_5270 family protein [Allokutzneria sp. NRRL B-24872]|uniref:CU044_5270 family protein n=1 Tax=Allokutzneria sp. NRRL B-24872 TaxID=1137961 RepID=UPI001178279A|nr:CU044_5270 family protein [Allokutzneria sp. NRRL B-24872]
MSEHAFESGRARVLAGPATQQPQRSSRRWLVAAAVLGVLTLGTVSALNLGGTAPAANAEAVAVLTSAADVTTSAEHAPVGPGQYRYVKTVESKWMGVVLNGASDANCWFRRERTEETWIPADWKQEWLRRVTLTEPLETRSCTKDQAVNAPFASTEITPWEARAKQGDFPQPKSRPGPGIKPADPTKSLGTQPKRDEELPPTLYRPTPEYLAKLPRDPQQLFVLLRDSTCLAEACALHAARSALDTGLIPDDLRAAMYRALTKIPGTTVGDRQANLGGRVGTAIRVTEPDRTLDLIIDPKTGDYIGARTVLNGEVQDFSSVVTGVTGAIGTAPR